MYRVRQKFLPPEVFCLILCSMLLSADAIIIFINKTKFTIEAG